MVEMIIIKIVALGRPVSEIAIPAGSNVQSALKEAQKQGVNIGSYDDLRVNTKPANLSDVLYDGSIITLVPAIRGGI